MGRQDLKLGSGGGFGWVLKLGSDFPQDIAERSKVCESYLLGLFKKEFAEMGMPRVFANNVKKEVVLREERERATAAAAAAAAAASQQTGLFSGIFG